MPPSDLEVVMDRPTTDSATRNHAVEPGEDRRFEPLTPCQVHADSDLWFAERADETELAKALCRTCSLLTQCLAGVNAGRILTPWRRLKVDPSRGV